MIIQRAVQILHRKRTVIGGELSFGGLPIEAVSNSKFNTMDEIDCLLNEGWLAISSHHVVVDGVHLIHFVLHKPDD